MSSGFEELDRLRFASRRNTGTTPLFRLLLIALCCALFLALVVLRG